jgi:hypothetical protein
MKFLVVTCKEMNREIRSYFRFFLNNKIKFLREYIMVNETCYCQYIFYRNLRARGHFRKRPGLEYRKKKCGYSFIYISSPKVTWRGSRQVANYKNAMQNLIIRHAGDWRLVWPQKVEGLKRLEVLMRSCPWLVITQTQQVICLWVMPSPLLVWAAIKITNSRPSCHAKRYSRVKSSKLSRV